MVSLVSGPSGWRQITESLSRELMMYSFTRCKKCLSDTFSTVEDKLNQGVAWLIASAWCNQSKHETAERGSTAWNDIENRFFKRARVLSVSNRSAGGCCSVAFVNSSGFKVSPQELCPGAASALWGWSASQGGCCPEGRRDGRRVDLTKPDTMETWTLSGGGRVKSVMWLDQIINWLHQEHT